MVSTVRFGAADVARVRFSISPLWESVRSLYALADPQRHVVHLPWIRRVRDLVDDSRVGPHLNILAALARPGAWLPDFLTPPPPAPVNRIEDELISVLAVRAETVQADLEAVAGRAPLPTWLRKAASNEPDVLLRRLVDAVDVWHRAAVTPYWPRIQGLLEGDVAHRTRDLAEGGLGRLIDRLHPTLRWHVDHIVADDPWQLDLELGGRGLPLLPSVFVDRRVLWTVRADSAPLAVYPARGAATLWQSRRAAPVDVTLAGVLGPTRARLLDRLQAPATTTELARRLGVSAAAVSQHLQAMRAAGLVSRVQHGRSALYATTPAGRTLLRAGGEEP